MAGNFKMMPIPAEDTRALKEALALVRDVFWDFVAPSYSDDGVMEFTDYIRFENIRAEIDAGRFLLWGGYVSGRLVGVLGVRPPNHISLMFVARAYQHKGVATALFRQAKAFFQKLGCAEISVHSSPYAVGIYKMMGFVPTGPEVEENGIRHTPMVYSIPQEPAQ